MLLERRIPVGYIVRKIRVDLMIVVIIATLVEAALHLQHASVPVIPPTIPAFLGTAITLLLSFKLNQSYDRWWEARKVWGAIVNDSRSLLRQLLSFAPDRPEEVARIGRRQIAWCYALGQALRGLDWKVGSVEHLSEEDIARAEAHRNKPLALLQLHGEDVAALAHAEHLTAMQLHSIDDTLTRLTNAMGMAERIKNTVFPKTYRVFLHGSIYLFITILAMALRDIDGAWQVGLTTVISLPFFLLEKTALHMQDPFENRPTDTSMTAIARGIEINLRQLLGDEAVPEPLSPSGFFLM